MGQRSSLIEYRDTEQQVNVIIKRPSNRYLNEFIGLKCAPDLLAWGVYPNVKEITESAAAFEAVRTRMIPRLSDKSISVLCVGDGRTPRTAAMFACRSAWAVWSIDPNLSMVAWESKIKRLHPFRGRFEDFDPQCDSLLKAAGLWDDVIVVAVHSHAALEQAKRFNPLMVVAIPCCKPQMFDDRLPDKEYTDWGIHSPERTVKVWLREDMWRAQFKTVPEYQVGDPDGPKIGEPQPQPEMVGG